MSEIAVRAVRLDDATALAEVSTQPQVVWGTLQLPAQSPEWWRQRLEQNSPDTSYILVAAVDGQVVAMAGLQWPNRIRERHVASLSMMVHDSYHGQGLGRRLLGALVEAADRWLNLMRIELEVYPDNAAAVRLYEQHGFVVEGRKRLNAWRDGEYVDSLVMGRLRPGLAVAQTSQP